MRVRYIGNKSQMNVYAPVGKVPTKRSKILCSLKPGETIELTQEEALALSKLDSINFSLDSVMEPVEVNGFEFESENPIAALELANGAVKQRRKRRTKAEMIAARGA